MKDIILKRFIREEGLRLFPYKDTKGIWTIGIGHNIEVDKELYTKLDELKKTGLTEQQVYELFENDYNTAKENLYSKLSWVKMLDEARQSVLIDLVFNMGISSLLKFKNTLEAIRLGLYQEAINRLRKSKWYSDVKAIRAEPLLTILLTGVL